MAGDLGYVIVFPQFLMAVHWPQHVNREGSIAGAAVGISKFKRHQIISNRNISTDMKCTKVIDSKSEWTDIEVMFIP